MRTNFSDLDIRFTIGDTRFQALNIIYEKFLRTVPSHSHGSGSYEIHYVPNGYGRARINGRFYDILPGTLYVTGPHVEHAQTPHLEDPMCEYCIYLKAEKRRRSQPVTGSEADGSGQILALLEKTPFWFGQDTHNVSPLVEDLFEELENRYTGYQLQVESLLRQILIRLVRNFEEKKGSGAPSGSLITTDKTAVIIEDYFLYEYQNLSLEELAVKLGLGTRQTERLLQKHYGKTFLQKKTEARMSAAAILLTDSSRSITSVAEALGYSSIEHFSSAFKNYYQVSPRQYRKEGAYHSFPLS